LRQKSVKPYHVLKYLNDVHYFSTVVSLTKLMLVFASQADIVIFQTGLHLASNASCKDTAKGTPMLQQNAEIHSIEGPLGNAYKMCNAGIRLMHISIQHACTADLHLVCLLA